MPKTAPYRHLAHVAPFQQQPIVYLTAVIHGRRPVLGSDSVHLLLRGMWQRSGERNGWYVGDYVLMPDHVHLFARPGHLPCALSEWIKMWKSVSARMLERKTRIWPPIWQEDYFDRYLRSHESYEEKWQYVRNNPVRAGLVANPDDWPFQGRIYDLGSL